MKTLPLFASLCELEEMKAGTVLCEQGAPGDKFFLIVHGKCQVVVKGPEGEIKYEGTLEKGKYFGELALVREEPRAATVIVAEKSVLMSITKESFTQFFAEAPEGIAVFQAPFLKEEISCRTLLHHPQGNKFFSEFCKLEFSEENINFWVECNDFRNRSEHEIVLTEREKLIALHEVKLMEARETDLYTQEFVDSRAMDAVENAEDGDHERAVATYQGDLGLPEEKTIREEVEKLYHKYISTGADTQVNLKSSNVSEIKAVLDKGYCEKHVLDKCVLEIEALLEKDSFARFKKHELFSKFLERVITDSGFVTHAVEEEPLPDQSVLLGRSATNVKTRKASASIIKKGSSVK